MRVWIGRGHMNGTSPSFTLDFMTANIATHKALVAHRASIETLLNTMATTIEEYANGSKREREEVAGEAGSGGAEGV